MKEFTEILISANKRTKLNSSKT